MELSDPAVNRDRDRKGECADDGKWESVLRFAFCVSQSAESDVDSVEPEVTDKDGEEGSNACWMLVMGDINCL